MTVASPSRSTEDATPSFHRLAQVAERGLRVLADDEAVRHVLDAGGGGACPARARPALVLPIRIATPIGGGGSSTSSQEAGQVARQVVEVAARGHDVDEAEQRGLELRVRGGEVHRLVVERLERVARGRQRRREPAPDLEQLALDRRVVDHGCTAYSAGTLAPMDRELELLSVVAPMYEEEDTVDPFTERVAAALGRPRLRADPRQRRLQGRARATRWRAAAARDPRVKVVSLVAQLRPPAGADRRARARHAAT